MADEQTTPTWTRRRVLGSLGALGLTAVGSGALLAACGSDPGAGDASTSSSAGPSNTTTPRPEHWPEVGGTWESVAPADVGWDAPGLEAALAFAGERASRSLVLALDGQIVAERTWGVGADFTRNVASCQKSVVALLVGIAGQRGLLTLTDPVTSHLGPGWSGADETIEATITLEHLLTMTSGLDDDLRSVGAPGSVWIYSNAYHRVQAVLEAVAASPIDDLCREWLWDRIGVSSGTWRPRPGTAGTSVDALGNRLWGLHLTARDMARVGLLVQRGGRWQETSILADGGYLDDALQPSQTLNRAYGHLWWLNGTADHLLPRRSATIAGPLIPGAPGDLVAALGKDDQKIYVSRSDGLVLTRLGAQAGTQRAAALSDFDARLWELVLAAAPD